MFAIGWILAAVTLSSIVPGTLSRASAYPINSNVNGCWKKHIWYYFQNESTDWNSSATALFVSAADKWEELRRTSGTKMVDFTRYSSFPPSGTRDTMVARINTLLGGEGFGACDIPGTATDGRVDIGPSVLNWTQSSQEKLYRHELGHIIGNGHTGIQDNWWNSEKPTMIPGCGYGSQRSYRLTQDDIAALQYNERTKSGDLPAEEWASADPGFENEYSHVRHHQGASVAYTTSSARAKVGNDLGIMTPTSSSAKWWTGVRVANQSDDGGDEHSWQAQISIKPASLEPTSGRARISLYTRSFTYGSHSCTAKFPIEFPIGALDNSVSYYAPSQNAWLYTNPTSGTGATQWIRNRSTEMSYSQLDVGVWDLGQTTFLKNFVYQYDYIAMIDSNLKRGSSYITLDIDQFGLRVKED